ncbi:unnamed protein product [Brassica napus]|uniref:(rape) hypothetical protein n=1 Tax=Brassica napus TaxID=3708 RepID=A0A816J0F1_BRANA|nr:unnamed protein product [Brassica napus]
MSNRLSVPSRSGLVFSRVTTDQARTGCGLQKNGPIPPCQSAQSLTDRSEGWTPKECIMTLIDAAGCSRTLQDDPLHTEMHIMKIHEASTIQAQQNLLYIVLVLVLEVYFLEVLEVYFFYYKCMNKMR